MARSWVLVGVDRWVRIVYREYRRPSGGGRVVGREWWKRVVRGGRSLALSAMPGPYSMTPLGHRPLPLRVSSKARHSGPDGSAEQITSGRSHRAQPDQQRGLFRQRSTPSGTVFTMSFLAMSITACINGVREFSDPRSADEGAIDFQGINGQTVRDSSSWNSRFRNHRSVSCDPWARSVLSVSMNLPGSCHHRRLGDLRSAATSDRRPPWPRAGIRPLRSRCAQTAAVTH